MHHQALAALLGLMLTGLSACSGCSDEAGLRPQREAGSASQTANVGTAVQLGELPSELAVTDPLRQQSANAHTSSEGAEFEPVEMRLFEYAGQVDIGNRYSSTVMVETHAPHVRARCSGVLIQPRLVLTAGHCVCKGQQVSRSSGEMGTIIDGSACEERVIIKTVVYEPGESSHMPSMRVGT